MQFQDFIYWAFLSIISAIALYHVKVLDKLSTSVSSLNVSVGILITKHEDQDKDLKSHDKDIEKIKEDVTRMRVSIAKIGST
jgi:hypothetical protein